MNNLEKLGLICATSSARDGNMSFSWAHKNGDSKESVIGNRTRFVESHGANLGDCAVMQIDHGDSIIRIAAADKGRGAENGEESIEAEALITNNPEVVLFLPTADCLPVTFFDPVKNVLALAHLGWKPSAKGLAQKVIQEMHAHYGCNPADIVINIGPSIRKESYLVEHIDTMQRKPEWEPFVEKTPKGYLIDLVGFNKAALIDAGVCEENIEVSPVDTALNQDYFSHHRAKRGGEKEGRLATIARLPVERGVQEPLS